MTKRRISFTRQLHHYYCWLQSWRTVLKISLLVGRQRRCRKSFKAVRISSGLLEGLYPIQATGVSTEQVVIAAGVFLESLNPEQLTRTRYAVDDLEWRNWSTSM